MTDAQRIGFIGLGAMGAPMAKRLLDAGFALTVWNRDVTKAAPLVAAGTERASSARDVAATSDVVVSVLFDDAAVDAVFLGQEGIAEDMRTGAIHLSCSTISPALADTLEAAHASRGQHLVCAPLLGSVAMAAQGRLYLAPSGPPAAIERLQPLFAALAQFNLAVGERPRDAVVAKLANNFLIFAVTQAIGEALALAETNGLSRAAMMDVLWQTEFGRRIFDVYGRKVLDRAFVPATAPTRLALKDIELALDAAKQGGAAMPLAELARERLAKTAANGWSEHEFAVVSLLTDSESGLPV